MLVGARYLSPSPTNITHILFVKRVAVGICKLHRNILHATRHPKADSCRGMVGPLSVSADGATHGNSKPVLKRCMYTTPTAPSVCRKVGSKGN